MIRWLWDDRAWIVATAGALALAFADREAAADVAACLILVWVAAALYRGSRGVAVE